MTVDEVHAGGAAPLGEPARMRRARQGLPPEETLGMLAAHEATSGVLALNDPDLGAPYTVPMSYAFAPATADAPPGAPLGSVYFHGSPRGRKVELLGADPRATFCVVAADEVVQEEFATHYRSAVVTGRLEVVRDDAERMQALRLLGRVYSPDLPPDAVDDEIAGSFAHVCVLALRVEHASGKQAKALADAARREGAEGRA